ncbi:LiaF transmembrane domain-containing protein [Candidatus Azobacteroides pseudotrichonymphae]|uniref:LiaF transmembrane domain-containing protein n=1 Tax=Azobacteroides pseudotrichonymphae genomovar. CFP2 TaxID=511995 RepID=B6YQG8_AZOPC|nr:hypothetical protein [Candidatus Azobacteroides pseudotrichonymphae]BAG83440.1 conserved hypothetical protein [Candidatus Azobacteroides pseudotrichonymphae genomovar. CFP2]
MKKIMTFGIIVVTLGIFLLVDNMGFLLPCVRHIVFSWQVLLITIGIILIANRKLTSGVILILIGLCFSLPNVLENFVFDKNLTILPITLIIIGMGLIIHAIAKKKCRYYRCSDKKTFVETVTSEEWFVRRNYTFSHSKEKWAYSSLKNIEIETIFSNIELNFEQVRLSEEDTVRIKIISVFSYVTLCVPIDWKIKLNQNGVFVSFSDERIRSEIDFKKVVFLEIEGKFSGGELKCCV